MKKRILRATFYLAIISLTNCCHNVDSRELIIYNKSDKSVYSIISNDDNMARQSYYDEFRDDIKSDKDKTKFKFIFREVVSNSKCANYDTPRYWDGFIESIPDKKLRLFIVSKDSVQKYGWHKIFKNNLYNKKYELTLESLVEQNWEVVYE